MDISETGVGTRIGSSDGEAGAGTPRCGPGSATFLGSHIPNSTPRREVGSQSHLVLGEPGLPMWWLRNVHEALGMAAHVVCQNLAAAGVPCYCVLQCYNV